MKFLVTLVLASAVFVVAGDRYLRRPTCGELDFVCPTGLVCQAHPKGDWYSCSCEEHTEEEACGYTEDTANCKEGFKFVEYYGWFDCVKTKTT